jgi:hypothetical protein
MSNQNNMENEFKSVMVNPMESQYYGNTLEYNRFQTIGDEFGGSKTNVYPPINVDLPSVIKSPNQVGNFLLQEARNTNTEATDATINSYRKLDYINTNKNIFNKVATKFQTPLDEKDVIFKYVPLNNINAMKQMIGYSENEVRQIDMYQLLLTSIIAFIICYIDNKDCDNTERILKSFVAALLGVIYIFAYLIKYTLVKCSKN